MIELSVVINTDKLDAVIANLSELDNFIVDAATGEIMQGAIQGVPVLTGLLQSTIEREVRGGEGVVFTGSGYGLFVEMGTVKMAAQPYLRPAFEAVDWFRIVKMAVRFVGL